MTNTLKGPGPVTLSAIDAEIYAVPALTKSTVALLITNTGNRSITFRLHHATSGVSTQGNAIFYDAVIYPRQVIELTHIIMEAGHSLRGLANLANYVNVKVSQVETS